MVLIKETSCRSRFALFISSVDSRRNGKGRLCIEPSRVPVKQMKRFLKVIKEKNSKLCDEKCSQVAKSYQIIRAPFLRKTFVFANGERITEANEFRVTKKYPLSLGSKMAFKSLTHKTNNIASKLSGNIETNPSPFVVDPSKTIHALYSQGNSLVFGSNAGKQCVAMSLIVMLLDFMCSARSSLDLGEIMNVGNELYTRLSQSAGQDLLMLTELPEVLCLKRYYV